MEGTETVVSQDGGAATPESTSTPESASTAAPVSATPAPGGAQPTSRTFSQEDVNRLIRERVAQEKRSSEKRYAELQQRAQQYEAYLGQLSQAEYARAKAMGYIKDEQPEYVTKEALQEMNKSLDERVNGQLAKIREAEMYQRVKSDWSKVETAFADYAKLPGFKAAWADKWDGYGDPMEIAKVLTAEYEKFYASRQAAAVAEKEKAARAAPLKPGGGTVSSAKSDEKVSLRQKIRTAMASRE